LGKGIFLVKIQDFKENGIMKQKTSFLLHAAAFSIVVLALSTSAWAQVTGTVWQVPGNEPTLTASIPTGTLLGSFNSSAINFSTGADGVQNEAGISLNTDQVLYGFLYDNGATITNNTISGVNLAAIMTGSTDGGASQVVSSSGHVVEGATTYLSTASTFDSSTGCYNGSYNTGSPTGGVTGCYAEIIEITGTATFVAGQTYGVTHDDGMIMTIDTGADAGTPINAPPPTSAKTDTFTVGTTETDHFTIWYQATNGNPSVLTANFGAAPEPGPISLLVTMLGGIAGLAFVMKKKLA
jgi:hypothetical protein